MSILNVTPDSFSDGGSYPSIEAAVEAVKQHVASGADIIDIGGVSTRPGSLHVTEAEELDRVIPVIRAIREAGLTVPISVDTYRASVARISIEQGANIINDISGGLHDPDMLGTVARLDCPFVLMHMRGRPEEVNDPKHQHYENGDVVGGVRKELAQTVRKALQAGIKRWNIILDPGVGFSKNQEGNLALIRALPEVTGRHVALAASATRQPTLLGPSHAGHAVTNGSFSTGPAADPDSTLLSNFPVLVGVSRKGFIGKITGQADPQAREFGNAAIHALSIANGANIIRVHDVDAARDVVRITDAIYGRQ